MKKWFYIILTILLIIFFSLIFDFATPLLKEKKETQISVLELDKNVEDINLKPLNCYKIEEKKVRGNSLQGLIEDGQIVKVLLGYYDCHQIERDDIILFTHGSSENPLIKIVKGIPGDKFNLQETAGGWHILINENILKNTLEKPYLIDQSGYKMLSLYIVDHNGIIPEQALLIMGNLTFGTTDSSRLGLISIRDVLGRAKPL